MIEKATRAKVWRRVHIMLCLETGKRAGGVGASMHGGALPVPSVETNEEAELAS